MPWKDGIPFMRHPIATAVAPRSSVQMTPESTRPYTWQPSFTGPRKLAAGVCRAGTLRGPVCRGPASSRQACAGPVHMGALLAGSRELGPDECHHWLDHVRNCQTCTGPFVKTLIARLVYLVLCGIRLIPHGTRQGRVCIFRYTWAGSCHGWNSYGTRRPRVCGVPRVTSSCVPGVFDKVRDVASLLPTACECAARQA